MTALDEKAGETLERDGFLVIERALPEPFLVELEACLDAPMRAQSRAGSRHGGRRNLLDDPRLTQLAYSEPLRRILERLLGTSCVAVRGLLFDKTPDANWRLGWHQDRAVALAERVEGEHGFGPWSQKDGVPHAHAPAAVLASMLAARLHLDDAGPENGGLKVIPGSHRAGFLDAEAGSRLHEAFGEVTCAARRGDLLVFRPLLLHASGASTTPTRRRVVQLEWAPGGALPAGLSWYWRRPER